MANNRIQVKRTSVSTRTPNTTNSSNNQYITAGELALNMADGILYSSNGSALLEIGSNNTFQNISTNNLTVGNTLYVVASGKVGIGVSSPSEKLQIAGNLYVQNTYSILLGTGGEQKIFAGGVENSTFLTFNQWTGLSYTERMRISENGRVGIGTSSPVGLLDVLGISYLGSDTNNSLYVNSNSSIVTIGAAGRSSFSNSDFRFITSDGSAALERMRISSNGNIGIGTTSPVYKLEVNGSFAATTKSFVIDHPTKPNYKLRYGSLESPYHGIRLTGEAEVVDGICVVKLPDYIHALCKSEGVNIQLTNIKHGKVLWVDEIDIDNNEFTVATETNGNYKFYWSFTAVRKDVEDMVVEFESK